ncbi:unnamed protein product, partial [Candidula unifasciata]
CRSTITNSSGVIQSHRYPGNFPENTTCSWTIIATGAGKTIAFSWHNYIIICNFDTLEVYDGNSTNAPLLGRYCGYLNNPGIIQSSGNTLYLTYQAVAQQYTRRFSASYSTNGNKFYRYNLTFPSGPISSPGYPGSSSQNTYVTWTVTVAPGYVVTLKFCGNNFPVMTSSTNNAMHIIYSSLGNTTEKGFVANYFEDGNTSLS